MRPGEALSNPADPDRSCCIGDTADSFLAMLSPVNDAKKRTRLGSLF